MMPIPTLAQQAPTEPDQIASVVNNMTDQAGRALTGDTAAMQALFVDYGLPLIWALIILVVAYIVSVIVSNSARSAMERAHLDKTLARFTARMARYVILLLGVIMAMSRFGIDVTAFAVVLAAAGFAIGMALSGTLSNFAAGVMLMIFRPFKVGQIISAAGITAKVDEIELFTTTFDTFDNRRIIVPNSSIFSNTIENISYHNERRIEVTVGVEYSADIDQTRQVLEKAAASLDNIIEGENRGTAVVLTGLGDSSVNWVVRAWVPAADFWPSQQALTRAVKMHLDDAHIGIPFPQMELHLNKQPATSL